MLKKQSNPQVPSLSVGKISFTVCNSERESLSVKEGVQSLRAETFFLTPSTAECIQDTGTEPLGSPVSQEEKTQLVPEHPVVKLTADTPNHTLGVSNQPLLTAIYEQQIKIIRHFKKVSIKRSRSNQKAVGGWGAAGEAIKKNRL